MASFFDFLNAPSLRQIEEALDDRLAPILKLLTKIMALLDDLTAQVARNTTVQQSAIVLLQGLKAKLDAAGTDPVKLAELSAQIGKNTDDLATAVTVNTPAEA